jgi:hypothetical protein
MPNASKAACELSIKHLFREDLFNRVEGCFLWTYTFADDVPPNEAARRWRLFVRWHLDTGRKCVRVLESGSKNGRWHYHCVTPQRWDVNEVRAAAERCGFGRINVKRIPETSARYVAKYLNKDSRGDLPKGQRRWGCVGFDGIPASRVKFLSRTVHLPRSWFSHICPFVEWQVEGLEAMRVQVRDANRLRIEEVHRVVISRAERESFARSLEAGDVLMLGEYRGFYATKKAFFDSVTNTRIEQRVVAEHTMAGIRETWTVSEWWPEGTKLESIPLPAKPGTVVKAIIGSVSRYRGQRYLTGVIKPLIEQGECHNESLPDAGHP